VQPTLELSNQSKGNTRSIQVYDRNGNVRNLNGSSSADQNSQVKVDLPWAGQVNASSVSGPETRFEMPIPTKQEAKEGIIGAAGLALITAGAVVAPETVAAATGSGAAATIEDGAQDAATSVTETAPAGATATEWPTNNGFHGEPFRLARGTGTSPAAQKGTRGTTWDPGSGLGG